MRLILKKIGNATALIIPEPLLAEIGAKAGDAVEIEVEDGRLVMSRIAKAAREGWAEAARRLGNQPLSEEEREWLDTPLNAEADRDCTW